MAKQPLLYSSVSRDPSVIILMYWSGAEVTFLIIISFDTFVLLNVFVETFILLFINFFIYFDE